VEEASGEAQEVRAKDEAAAAHDLWQFAASIMGVLALFHCLCSVERYGFLFAGMPHERLKSSHVAYSIVRHVLVW
jgi:hypothetical protein